MVSPLYFAGAMMLGSLMQIASAFGQVQSALSFFVKAYSEIADWKAVLNRLAGFDASIDWAKSLDTTAPRVEHVADGGTALTAEQLTVALPNGRGHRAGPAISSLSPPSGCWSPALPAPARPACSARSAASGRSASGPSACRRGASLLVLPQKPYLPLGTLRGALAYPGPAHAFPPDEIDEVLDATGLDGSAGQT